MFLKDFLFGVCVLEDLLSFFDFRSSLQCFECDRRIGLICRSFF